MLLQPSVFRVVARASQLTASSTTVTAMHDGEPQAVLIGSHLGYHRVRLNVGKPLVASAS